MLRSFPPQASDLAWVHTGRHPDQDRPIPRSMVQGWWDGGQGLLVHHGSGSGAAEPRFRSLSSGFLVHLGFLVGLASIHSLWEIWGSSSCHLSESRKFSEPSLCQAGTSIGFGGDRGTNRESFCSVSCRYLFPSHTIRRVWEELKRQDTKWVARLQILSRTLGSWKPYSLEILTPTPKHRSDKRWLQYGFWYYYPLSVCSLVAANSTHGHLWGPWCGLLQT